MERGGELKDQSVGGCGGANDGKQGPELVKTSSSLCI